jgi:hypothetical protein
MSIIYGNVKPTFLEIYPDWKYITKTSPKKTVLRAGTPLGANGRVANSSAALGLVVEDTGESDNPISIVVGGLVDYAKVQASYGVLSVAAVSALTGIRLIGSNGTAVVPSGLPDYSEASDGDALVIEDGVPAWGSAGGGGGYGGDIYAVTVDTSDMMTFSNPSKTVDEISAAFNDGKLPILRCRIVQGETIAFLPIVFYFVGGIVGAVVFTDVGGGNGDLTILADGTVEHTTNG